jgi:hypothetical protein
MITNYREYKYDNRYMVYEFSSEEHADHFASLLNERDVIFERHLEDEKILFGVEKRYRSQSDKCNFLTHAAFRKPMIPNKVARFVLLIVTLLFIALGILSYFKWEN